MLLLISEQALYEVLIRQEELLGYVDRQHEAKLKAMQNRKRFLCRPF